MQVHWSDQHCLVVLEKGEELIQALRGFAEKYEATPSFFYGLGAVDRVKVGVFNESVRSYLFTEYKLHLEISSLTGNIFLHEGKPFVHAHGAFSGNGGMSFGGHVGECEISPVCEIHLTKLSDIKARRAGSLPLPKISER